MRKLSLINQLVNILVNIFIATHLLMATSNTATADVIINEDMSKKFTLKVPEGDCIEGQLPGDFMKFTAISQNDCASYCSLNNDCLGYSFNITSEGKGDCNLKSINDCAARVPSTFKFYSKNL